jgi:exonuclease III
MRIATWNIKQIAPRKPLPERRQWMVDNFAPDVAILTEADLAVGRTWTDWNVVGQTTAIGKGQNFATYVVSPKYKLEEITEVKTKRKNYTLDTWYPGILKVADLFDGSERWGTIIGMYGVTRDLNKKNCGHGYYSTTTLAKDIEAIVASGRDRIVVAGDLNMLPNDFSDIFADLGLIDVIDATSSWREPLPNCTGCDLGDECGHLWTHKNGPIDKNGIPQQLDYIFISDDLADDLADVVGGIQSFPDAWEYSDHAPVIADFDSE